MHSKGGGPSAGHDEQVWLLGNDHPAADRSIGWRDPLPNLADPDVLIVDMTTLTEGAIREMGDGNLNQVKKQIEDKFLGGGTIVVVTAAKFSVTSQNSAPGLPISPLGGAAAGPYARSNYSMLPVALDTVPVPAGREIKSDEVHNYKEYVDAVEHFKFYIAKHGQTIHSSLRGMKFILDHVDSQDIRDNSGHHLGFELGAAAVGHDGLSDWNENAGYLVFLPPYTEPAADAIGKILSTCGKALPRGRALPPWTEQLSLGPASRNTARIEELEGSKAKLQGEIDELAHQNSRILAHRRLLYSDGPDLEDAVVEAFRALGFDDIERMGNRGKEDAAFAMGGTRYSHGVIEAKGAGKGTKMQHILQCSMWAEQRAAAEGRPAKGVFVPNQHRHEPYPESRGIRTRIEDNQLEHAERKDICIIPSCALYEAVRRVLDGEAPDRAKIAARIAGAKGVLTDVL